MFRVLRQWTTARATDAALLAAPRLSPRAIDRVAAVFARCGPVFPVVAAQVAANMRELGVYSAAAHRAYFAQLGVHFAGALHMLAAGGPTAAAGPSSALAELVAERVELDESIGGLKSAVTGRRGAILMGPHIAGYLLQLARLNQEVPLTVYLRYSRNSRRQEAKQRWYQASGVGWISEPANAGGALGRLGRMADVLRQGRVLFITPDLPQKREDGLAVRFFGREIYLPAGPAVLAVRTGAPLYMLAASTYGDRQQLTLRGPFKSGSDSPARSERHAEIAARLQWFAAELEQFLVQQAPLWYLWGDKRWTRLLRGDSRYVRRLEETAPIGTSQIAPDVAGAG